MPIEKIPIAVAYTKGNRKKIHVKVFKDLRCVDGIIRAKSKLLPENAVIKEVGVGKKYYEKYKKL